jgi:hypothetical protein
MIGARETRMYASAVVGLVTIVFIYMFRTIQTATGSRSTATGPRRSGPGRPTARASRWSVRLWTSMPFWRKRVRVEPEVLRSLDPYWVVARTDGFVAATVPEGDEWPCGIWNAETGELVVPCVAACWLQGLDEVLIVTEEYSGNLERRHWPRNEVLEKTEIAHRKGWVDHVVAAPTTTLAAVRWIDQTEAGFELFGLEERGVRQLERRGYRTGESNLLQGPVLDPSAGLAACTEGRSISPQARSARSHSDLCGNARRDHPVDLVLRFRTLRTDLAVCPVDLS